MVLELRNHPTGTEGPGQMLGRGWVLGKEAITKKGEGGLVISTPQLKVGTGFQGQVCESFPYHLIKEVMNYCQGW